MELKHLQNLALFPLPNAVFFPDTLLPLHIFEGRYRAMFEDALSENRPVAIALLKPGYEATYEGQPETHEVAGLGEIIHSEKLPDGRFNVILRGVARVRILDEGPLNDGGYRQVCAELINDVESQPQDLQDHLVTLQGLIFALGNLRPKLSALLLNRFKSLPTPGEMTNNIASILLATQTDRQATLEEASVLSRLKTINNQLTQLILEANETDPQALN